jgi:hypothetical protein
VNPGLTPESESGGAQWDAYPFGFSSDAADRPCPRQMRMAEVARWTCFGAASEYRWSEAGSLVCALQQSGLGFMPFAISSEGRRRLLPGT